MTQVNGAPLATPGEGRTGIAVRGSASLDELAALLAALLGRRGPSPAEQDGYRLWRSRRLAALRRQRAERVQSASA